MAMIVVLAAFAAPVAARVELGNGIPVFLVEERAATSLVVEMVVRGVRDGVPAREAGAAAVVARQVARAAGAREVEPGEEAAILELVAPAENLATELERLAQAGRHPRFSRLTTPPRVPPDAAGAAEGLLLAQLYGRRHPYGVPWNDGRGFTVGALRRAWQGAWQPKNAAFVVVGPGSASVVPLLQTAFGAWGVRADDARTPRSASVPIVTRVAVVEVAGTGPLELRVATPGPARKADNFPAALVAGEVARRRLGLSGGLTESRDHAVFELSGTVTAAEMRTRVAGILEQLRDLAAQPPDDAEIDVARASLPTPELDSPLATARAFARAAVFALGPDPLGDLARAVEAIPADEVRAAIRRFLHPNRMIVVVAGPRASDVEGFPTSERHELLVFRGAPVDATRR
jgi:hypothetical protein